MEPDELLTGYVTSSKIDLCMKQEANRQKFLNVAFFINEDTRAKGKF